MKKAQIHIYSHIGEGGVTAQYVQSYLDKNADADELDVYVNSTGGEVYEGQAIHQAFTRFKGKTTFHITGYCGSIATYIVLAGDEVIMYEGSRFMIHNPAASLQGESKDFVKAAEHLESIKSDVLNKYAKKTGKDLATLSNLMDSETEFSAQEAKEFGFADSVRESLKAVAYIDQTKLYKMDKKEKQVKDFLNDVLNKIKAFTNEAPEETITPVNMAVELAEGGMIFIDSESAEDLEGKSVYLADENGENTGTPLEDGEYALATGETIAVEAGVIVAVMAAVSEEMKEANATIEALKKELEVMKSEKMEAEKISTETTEKMEAFKTEIDSFKNEVEKLKAMDLPEMSKPKMEVPAKAGSTSKLPEVKFTK